MKGGKRDKPVKTKETGESGLSYKQLLFNLNRRVTELEAIFNTSPIGLAISEDAQGLTIRGNLALERMLGLQSGSELSLRGDKPGYRTFCQGEEMPVEELPMQRACRGETVAGQILDIMRGDGTAVTLYSSAEPLLDPNGSPCGAVGAFMDITGQRLIEEALRKNEATLFGILNATQESIWLISTDAVMMMGNEIAFKRASRPPGEIIGKHFNEILSPELARTRGERLREVIETKRPVEFEDERAGIFFRHSFYPIEDEQGKVLSVVSYSRDITERKRAEEAQLAYKYELELTVEARTEELSRVNDYNRGLIEASIDPLVTIGHDGRITDVNSATEKVTGVPRKELIGRDFADFFTEPERARAGYRKVFRVGSVRDYGLEIRHVNGQVTPVLYNATVYRDNTGEVAGVFAAARDITKLKLAEKELANRQAIINNMAMEFSMGQEHERQLIAEQLHDQVAPKLFLAKMKVHALFERLPGEEYDSALEAIDSLIDLGVQDIRSLSMQLRPPMLTEMGLVAALRWLCEEFRENYGLLIDFEDDGRSKPLTAEMRSSIFQVVRELLLNVVKHARTKSAALSVMRKNGTIMVKVEDNGVGFDVEDSSLTSPHSGGFGTYNSRMKIEYLGGALRIDSSPGRGTRIIIKAPISLNGNREGDK